MRLHAGPWSVELERWSGWVRCIRLEGIEAVRSIYAAIRDQHWSTVPQRICSFHASQLDGGFEADWTAESEEVDFQWTGRLRCDGTSLSVDWVGNPGREFMSRRTGVCLLHPSEIQGAPCEVTHPDGKVETGRFPTQIEPHQPFFEISEISHALGQNLLRIAFQGEIFEMEDQRNWTDASFKTYCRPQGLPQPFRIAPGEQIHHAVTLTYQGNAQAWSPPSRVLFQAAENWTQLPKLGLLSSSSQDNFDFTLNRQSPVDWSNASLGNYYSSDSFVNLNRNRPDSERYDGVAFAANPQSHAFDERSIMENVLTLRDAVVSAKQIAGGKNVAVGPLSLRSQERDPRLEEEFGTAWAFASTAVLADAGAAAVCFGDWPNLSNAAREIWQRMRLYGRIRLMYSSDPYRALAFEIGEGPSKVAINLRPYTTSVHLGEDYELEPYEIKWIE